MNVLVIDDDLCFLNTFKEQIIVSFDDVECDLYTSMPDVTTLKEEYDVIVIDHLYVDMKNIC